MDQRSDRLYPSAPLENIDLEQRLVKKMMLTVLITQSTTLKK